MKPTRSNQAPEWEWQAYGQNGDIFLRETPADQFFGEQLINILFSRKNGTYSALKLAK